MQSVIEPASIFPVSLRLQASGERLHSWNGSLPPTNAHERDHSMRAPDEYSIGHLFKQWEQI